MQNPKVDGPVQKIHYFFAYVLEITTLLHWSICIIGSLLYVTKMTSNFGGLCKMAK